MTEYIVKCKEYVGISGAMMQFPEYIDMNQEIVRCGDCKYYMDYEHEYEPNLGYCGFHDMQEVRDSRFCAWGKRKEGGDD